MKSPRRFATDGGAG
uniref:Uncharacterized protein n=1 Tax=Arundo donax TaxID=35708 RepID=A0A0A9AIL0_ARUDO